MTEVELASRMRSAGFDLHTAKSVSERGLILEKALKWIIPPRNISDISCFRRVCGWLVIETTAGRFNEFEIFRRVIDFALEASMPPARKPAAVFMSILKKELNYVSNNTNTPRRINGNN
jgi:hypothetical protein